MLTIILLVCIIAGSALEVIGVGAIPAFITVLLNPDTIQSYSPVNVHLEKLGINNTEELLIWGSILLIVVFLVKNGYLTVLTYVKAKFLNSILHKLSVRLFSAYITAPYTFHLNRNSADLLRNLTSEVKLIIKMLTDILYGIMDITLIAGILMLLLWSEPFITLIVVGVLAVPSGGFMKSIKKSIKKHGVERQQQTGKRIKAVNHGLGILKESRILGRDRFFIDSFTVSSEKYTKTKRYMEVITMLPRYILETVTVISMLLIGLILVVQGRDINSIIPILTLFGVAVMRLMPAVKELVARITDIRFHIFAIEPIYNDMMELNNKSRNIGLRHGASDTSNQLILKNTLEVQNVHYRYPGSRKEALNGVTLAIQSGTAVGIVGPSGAGKSTLIDVLLGLFIPQEGKILVDGYDIKEDMERWRRNIGYIPQQIYLIDDTIRNNIAIGLHAHEIDDEKVWKAIEAAQLEGLIRELPDGLETLIGERGIRLSGGQRQRIGIARALYNNPKVLIMDEATSALDNETEKFILRVIDQLRGDRTIIMIAHRLTTVKNCDVLYYMKDGKILTQGTYQELFADRDEILTMGVPEEYK